MKGKKLLYSVKGEEFVVDPAIKVNTPDRYRTPLEALAGAIKFAKECAENEDVDVLKVQDGKVTVAFTVDKQGPRPPRKLKDGWHTS